MNRKVRVLNLLPLGGIGGAEKFVLSLCRHHDKDRFEIMVSVLFLDGKVSRQIAGEGYKVSVLSMVNGFDFFRAIQLVFLIRREKIDIVNIHGQNPLGKLFSILGCPSVIIHTDHGTTINSPVKRKQRVVLFNRMSNPFFDHYIAISKGMKQSLHLREKVPYDKITLIYNGVDVSAISNISADIPELKKSLHIPSNLPVLGTVGRLAPEKEYPKLLKALSVLKNHGVGFIALIAGDGPQRNYLENLSREMNLNEQVRFLGQREDIYQLLNLMDIFVFPSGGEAFSITLLEAMAKKKPVVAFDVDGVNEAVISHQTGFLAPFGEIDMFAQKVKLLIESPGLTCRMGQAAYDRVSADFDLKKNIKKLERLYEYILKSKKIY